MGGVFKGMGTLSRVPGKELPRWGWNMQGLSCSCAHRHVSVSGTIDRKIIKIKSHCPEHLVIFNYLC